MNQEYQGNIPTQPTPDDIYASHQQKERVENLVDQISPDHQLMDLQWRIKGYIKDPVSKMWVKINEKSPEINPILVSRYISYLSSILNQNTTLSNYSSDEINRIMSLLIKWIFMNKKVISLNREFWKDVSWQIFLAPIGGGLVFVAFIQLSIRIIWPPLSAPFSGTAILIPAIAMLAILMLIGVFLIYMPVTSYLGFWDERSLKTFKRSVALSGPSIWLIWPMYKIFEKFHQKSPFKKRARIDLTEVARNELIELAILKQQSYHEMMFKKKGTEDQN